MVDLFNGTISGDSTLKTSYPGLQVHPYIDRKVLATTILGGPGNAGVAISKSGGGPFEWNAGGLAGQQRQKIRIDVFAKAQQNAATSARDVTDGIMRRIQSLLFFAQYLGTGWLFHKEVEAKFPSAPMKTRAYGYFIEEVMVSMG